MTYVVMIHDSMISHTFPCYGVNEWMRIFAEADTLSAKTVMKYTNRHNVKMFGYIALDLRIPMI